MNIKMTDPVMVTDMRSPTLRVQTPYLSFYLSHSVIRLVSQCCGVSLKKPAYVSHNPKFYCSHCLEQTMSTSEQLSASGEQVIGFLTQKFSQSMGLLEAQLEATRLWTGLQDIDYSQWNRMSQSERSAALTEWESLVSF